MSEKIYDIVIVGAGAAGKTAALYALPAKKTVLLFEATASGGQIINTHKIDNYPAAPGISGVEFSTTLKKQVESFGGEFEFAKVEKITEKDGIFSVETDDEDLGEIQGKTIIIANGSTERKLGLEKEEKFVGRGISYCATCDGGFFKGKRVAVYGGGNTALYSALYLSEIAEKVFILARHELRAEKSLVEKAEKLENIEIFRDSPIAELLGEKKFEGVRIKDGRELRLDGLFVSIGRLPENEAFRGFVELDEAGYIKSDETCKTSREGVFCAGDTRAKTLHQLVTATADGATAATAAIEYLQHS